MNNHGVAFKLKAEFLKALAHPLRLAIIETLKSGERSVGQIVNSHDVDISNVSKNLAILRQVGVLTARQEKSTVYYAVRDRTIFEILRPLSEMLGNHLKESVRLIDHLGEN